MARDRDGGKPAPGVFERIDPFCWLLVVAMLITALLMTFMGLFPVTAGIVGAVAVVLTFDSWANRPEKPTAGREPSPRTRGAQQDRRTPSSSTRSPRQRAAPSNDRMTAGRPR